jgi:hypothetical protein
MRRQTFAGLAVVSVLALGVTACNDRKDPAASKSNDLDAMRKFAQCMRQNGVDMADPTDDGGHIVIRASAKPGAGASAKMKAAEEKCRHFQPNGGKPVKLDPKDLAKLRAMAKCMREHGVDMPDPDDNGRITVKKKDGGKPPADMGPDSPTFKAADKACRKYAPEGAERHGGGS